MEQTSLCFKDHDPNEITSEELAELKATFWALACLVEQRLKTDFKSLDLVIRWKIEPTKRFISSILFGGFRVTVCCRKKASQETLDQFRLEGDELSFSLGQTMLYYICSGAEEYKIESYSQELAVSLYIQLDARKARR